MVYNGYLSSSLQFHSVFHWGFLSFVKFSERWNGVFCLGGFCLVFLPVQRSTQLHETCDPVLKEMRENVPYK